jgi:enamine deaminase RidA (YjgF/YER057c/UK114 family)
MLRRIDIENGRLCNAVVHGETIYLAGQIPENPDADATAQTASVLAQIDELLARAGSDKRHILQALVVLADIRDAPAMNAAWDAWVDPEHPPARATIEGKLVDPRWKVEIVVTAARAAE